MRNVENVCSREGCRGWKHYKFTHCSFLCSTIERELHRIQALVDEAGPGTVSAELWASAVTLGDNYSEVAELTRRLKKSLKRRNRPKPDDQHQAHSDPTVGQAL